MHSLPTAAGFMDDAPEALRDLVTRMAWPGNHQPPGPGQVARAWFFGRMGRRVQMVLVSYDGYPFIPDEGTISAINGATVTIEQSPRLRHIWDLIDGEVIHVTDTEIVIHSPYVDFGHYRLIRLADSD